MKLTIRTVLAYLVAPLTTPVIMGVLEGLHESTRIFSPADFGGYVLIACVTSYPVAWVLGTLAFIVLRQTRSESVITYTGCAAIGGAVYGFAIGLGSPAAEHAYLAILFALLAAPTGAVFCLIRGANRSRDNTRQQYKLGRD